MPNTLIRVSSTGTTTLTVTGGSGNSTGSVDSTMFGNVTLMSAADTAALGLSGAQYEATFSGQRFWLEVGSINLVPLAPVLIPEPASAGLPIDHWEWRAEAAI